MAGNEVAGSFHHDTYFLQVKRVQFAEPAGG